MADKVQIYGPCVICGHDVEEDLNFEALIHHNAEVRCFNLKECRKRQRKRQRKKEKHG